ncbi:MAG: hypothetical protein M1818_002638 [Claussenomyces sp. TS43310]|nr:MAG: hypothetical protein M1818_002638 [Claussenomyces sp. TS43310]
MAGKRRKNLIASRRRVDDEGEEDGGPDALEQDDDSLSEVSFSEDEAAEGSDHGHPDAASSEIPKAETNGHTALSQKPADTISSSSQAPAVKSAPTIRNGVNDTEMMMNGLSTSDHNGAVEAVNYEDLQATGHASPDMKPSPPIVNSTAQMDLHQDTPLERRRREHDEYKKKRDADPAFVPNRGAFFMHDHRHAGPAANGFRPFGRGRGRGRGGMGGPFAPFNHVPQAELTDAPWTHDMHETVLEDHSRGSRQPASYQIPYSGPVPQAPRGPAPNRSLSSTKHIGNVQIRLLFDNMKEPIKFPPIAVNQYTRLPDHRPPLRRDKPVRISLPDHPPRYIFPAQERSFIFIPRAMRPNQQGFGSRSRARPGLGSTGGYSRRTSMYGGSVYGSAYTPSVAMSRRSSLAYEVPRDNIISPTGSSISRPPMPNDVSRPVVRLPPSNQQNQFMSTQASVNGVQPETQTEPSAMDDLQRSQTYPLPQKPTFRENRPNVIPMHQPRPQKSVSVADIESPATLSFNPPQQQQQPFHQQVPAQVIGNGHSHEPHVNPHSRNPSYPSQASTGTPLSQIPERAIHAPPFQPQPYQQQPPTQSYYPQQYPIMPPQQGFYYGPSFNSGMAPQAPAYVPVAQQPSSLSQPNQQQDPAAAQQSVPANLVAQEVNGMVYYYDATQIPAVATFPAYQAPQPYPIQQVGGVVGMGGMMTPSPDGFYSYPQATQGVVYYQQ